ncbi:MULTISPECIES: flagellar filament capping protein FliD [Halanaerobium]|jgi:flagellar hook-associated protein 2|uniref:Flagellar hook-associated protein 2 n=1 Tax=Halanaerobium congolense TaxID=54121 RepID=A0A1G6QH07_9FIRM|nr:MULTISPECIES: flagellar filament capping protein FliD [Halanaerobium]PUU86918.1 MAG: flagellar hook-associated protein 2 [Halanaerobium sp.]PUU88913.1 MAG: flagellar hook-associated protein 2 [Halanaerobium sp.]SDC90967.1 flagellar hook-associated protein 2 [Halanaerobium congolense]
MSDLSLGGLATGMDTQGIIDQLVQLEKKPIYNYQQEISEMEQTKGAWRDINSRLDNLENTITDLKLSSTYNSRTTTSSNQDVVTATASNSTAEANYDIKVKRTAKAQRIFGGQMADAYTASADDTITIKGTDIAVTAGDTLTEISNKINEAEAGVSASIVDNRLVLEASETGVDNALKDTLDTGGPTISDNNGILAEIGVLNTDGEIINEPQQASDAEIAINGITGITSSSNEFSDAVEGVTFKINPEAAVDSTATISVAKDTAKATEAVQAFVDQYNSVMDFIDSKSSYDSVTKEGGILQGDGTIMRLQMRLRELATAKVKDGGNYQTLSSVGIEIDRDGVMSLDSSKLTEALENNPEEIINLFQAESNVTGYDGMAVRMDSYLDQVLQSNTGLIPRRLDFYDTRIESLNEDIADVERQVEMTRQRYMEQFTNMESAISEMNQQMSWMQSQLSSLAGSSSSGMQ